MKLFVGAKALVEYKGKILLLRESGAYADGTNQGMWDFPGGRIEPEETTQEGLLREVREEVGLEVVAGRVLGVYDGFPEIRGEKCHIVRIYRLCTAIQNTVVLSHDHDDFVWVSPIDALSYPLMDDLAEVIQEYQNGAS